MGATEYAFAAGMGWGIALGLGAALFVALWLRPRTHNPPPKAHAQVVEHPRKFPNFGNLEEEAA